MEKQHLMISYSQFFTLFKSYRIGFICILISFVGYIVIFFSIGIVVEQYTKDISRLTDSLNILGELTNKTKDLANIFESLKIIGYWSTAFLIFGVLKLLHSTNKLLS